MPNQGFNQSWEKNIYARGRQMNKYPYNLVISLVASYFSRLSFSQRKKIKALDLGCGAGNNARFLAEYGFQAFGLDGSETAIKECRKRFKQWRLPGSFTAADFIKLPFKDNFFDLALDRESLCANDYQTISKAVKETRRVLKPGGIFISFMFGLGHLDIKYGKKLAPKTYGSFSRRSSFYQTGLVHFTDLAEIKRLFAGLKLIKVMKHSLKEVYSQAANPLAMAEYIIVARKA